MSPSTKSVLKRNQGRVRLLGAHGHATKETIRGKFSENGESFVGVWLSGLTQTTYFGDPRYRFDLPPSACNAHVRLEQQY